MATHPSWELLECCFLASLELSEHSPDQILVDIALGCEVHGNKLFDRILVILHRPEADESPPQVLVLGIASNRFLHCPGLDFKGFLNELVKLVVVVLSVAIPRGVHRSITQSMAKRN